MVGRLGAGPCDAARRMRRELWSLVLLAAGAFVFALTTFRLLVWAASGR